MQFRASHILVKTEQEAKRIRAELKDEEDDFKEMARSFSLCPSKRQGGDLGWFEPEQMVKEFSDTCKRLKISEISEPIKTQFGFHIIKLTGKK